MSYFRPCPDCGANLDPEEKCDCRKEVEEVETEVADDDATNEEVEREEESL